MFKEEQRTIYNWLNRWESRGVAGLYNLPGKGAKPNLTAPQKAQSIQWVKPFPKNLKKVIVLVKDMFGLSVSLSPLKRVNKARKMSWRRIHRPPKKKPDPLEYQKKKQTLETLKAQDDKGEKDLYYFDESGFCLDSQTP